MLADFSSEEHSVPTHPGTTNASSAVVVDATRSNAELWRAGRYDELSARLSAALVLAESGNDRGGLIDAANDLACTHRALGDHETAAYFQLMAANSEHQSVDQHSGRISATSLGNLACDALLAGRLPIAESLLWKSLLAELAAGNEVGIAADWANLGLLAGLQGDLDLARQRLWEALKLHRRQQDHLHVGLDLQHLAQVFELEGNWNRAGKLYEKAAIQFTRAGNPWMSDESRKLALLNQARDAVLKFDAGVN